jgi:hypothetical protein
MLISVVGTNRRALVPLDNSSGGVMVAGKDPVPVSPGWLRPEMLGRRSRRICTGERSATAVSGTELLSPTIVVWATHKGDSGWTGTGWKETGNRSRVR